MCSKHVVNVYIFRAIEFFNLNDIDELFLSLNSSQEISGKIIAEGQCMYPLGMGGTAVLGSPWMGLLYFKVSPRIKASSW